jgi:nuclear GTP-binding protein
VAAEAGWTRDLQSVQIDRGIRILDSPGVVFDEQDPSSSQARSGVLLRNVFKVEDVEDPLAVGKSHSRQFRRGNDLHSRGDY